MRSQQAFSEGLSPAEKAGIKAGDVIVSINKRSIKNFNDLVRTLNYYNPDEKVSVEISRKGDKKTVDVILGEKKHKQAFKGIEKLLPGGKMQIKIGPHHSGGKKMEKRIKINNGKKGHLKKPKNYTPC